MREFARGAISLLTSTGIGRQRVPDLADVPDLGDRHVVVTGGSRGIGRAIVQALAARGATVVMACRDVAAGERTRSELATRIRGRVLVERLDIASLDEVRDFASRVSTSWPRVDVLVHNAGASFPERHLSVDGHELTFATNVLGGFFLTRLLVPLMPRGGRIVHVGSMAQYLFRLRTQRLLDVGARYLHEEVYGHSKRAQFELSELWAERLTPEGITSTCMHPGLVATPGVAAAFPAYSRLFSRLLRRPDDGANTAVWLAASTSAIGESGGFWFDRARQPADLVPWTMAPAGERAALWDACDRLSERPR